MELIRILSTANEDRQAASQGRRDSEVSETDTVISKFRAEFEFLLAQMYYNWLKELKRTLSRMIIPAVVEHQGLPGFMDDASNNVGFFHRLMGAPNNSPPVSIEKLLAILTKVHDSMIAYHVDDTIR
jgi:hypothetical protein